MRMRESLDRFEQAFVEEAQIDKRRAEALRRQAAVRSRNRVRQRQAKRSTLRFVLLVLTLIATAVGTTFLMFEALYLALG